MRTLVLSDIHENIRNVKLIRKREANVYDAVICGGDIGSGIAEEFYSILDSFNCPVFCVYGNWDHDLPYKRKLSKNCVLLHHSVERVKDFFVTGFSGCPTSWGRNPIYLAKKEELLSKHRAILLRRERINERAEKQIQKIKIEWGVELRDLAMATKDKRKKAYKRRVAKVWKRRLAEIAVVRQTTEKIYSNKAYEAYHNDDMALTGDALISNRNSLFDLIRKKNLPQDRLIIVTHERMFKINDEGVTPLLHVFGHIHKYGFSLFKGTHYLNAAAVDNGMSEAFGRKELLPEGYCDVEISKGQVTVIRKTLQLTKR